MSLPESLSFSGKSVITFLAGYIDRTHAEQLSNCSSGFTPTRVIVVRKLEVAVSKKTLCCLHRAKNAI